MPHRQGIGPFPVGNLLRMVITEMEQPNIGRSSASVTLPVFWDREECVGQPLTVRADGSVDAIGDRQLARRTALGGHGAALVLEERAKAIGVEEKLAVRRPTAKRLVSRMMGELYRDPTGYRQGVEIPVPVAI